MCVLTPNDGQVEIVVVIFAEDDPKSGFLKNDVMVLLRSEWNEDVNPILPSKTTTIMADKSIIDALPRVIFLKTQGYASIQDEGGKY